MIPTLTGDLSPDDLGTVLMHEHVFVLNAELMVNYPELFPEDQMVARAVEVLTEVQETGVDTFVDLSVMGTGRNVPVLQRIAQQVDLNILAATGWYTYHEAPVFAQLNGPGRLFDGPDPLTEMFVRDIRDGISSTGVRAAVLKCSADKYGMTDGVRLIMQAVADAHLETGAPIFTHSDSGNDTGSGSRTTSSRGGSTWPASSSATWATRTTSMCCAASRTGGPCWGWTASDSNRDFRTRTGCRRSWTCAPWATRTGWSWRRIRPCTP